MIMPRMLRVFTAEVRGMHEAAYLLALFSFGSQLLALVRDRLLAAVFGAGHTLDLYYAAFRVPDLIFATVASLFSLYALLPILSRLEREGEGAVGGFLRSTLAVFFAGMAVVGAMAFVLAPVLAPLVAPGISHDPASASHLVLLMRILLLQSILLGASNTIAALTQLRHRFVLYSVSPLLYNLGIIFGAVVLYPLWGIGGLAWGVVLGAAMHLGVQVPYFLAERPRGEPMKWPELRTALGEVLFLSVPRTLALSARQFSILVLTALASWMAAGSIAVFTFAYNLQSVPLTIIGVSYSVAAFPTLARLFAAGQREEFAAYIEAAVRHIIFWALPATVFIIVLRAQIVRVVLGSGAFDWAATRLTAAALALFVVSLVAQSIALLVARVYYAAGESKKPVFFGLFGIAIAIGSASAFVTLFHGSAPVRLFLESLLRVDDVGGTTVLMLALAFALGAVAECALGYWYLLRDFRLDHARPRRLFFESAAASLIGGAAAYEALSLLGPVTGIRTALGLVAQGVAGGAVGIAVAVAVLVLLGNREIKEVHAALMRRFRDIRGPAAVEPSDVA
jgi:putative peptidoglycan lipid II flippase